MKYTRLLLRAAFAVAAFFSCAGSLEAQLTPIPGVFVSPPQINNPSAFLSDWQSRASTATVIVTNTNKSAFQAKIWVEFKLNGSVVAYTQAAKLPPTTIQPGTNMFNGETIAPLNTVHFNNNVDQSSQRAGRIPDGLICIIVHVLNPATGQESVSLDGCNNILSFTPPTLILPADKSQLCKLGNNNVIDKTNGQPMPMFQWTPIVPAPQSQVTYHFAIFEVLPGQSPITAFQSARPLFVQDLPNLTNFIWPVQYFLPEKGKTYTWSVQALDPLGRPFILENNGWATPYTFTVTSDCDVNGISGILILPQILDFGSEPLHSGPVTKQITLQNIGNEPVALQLPTLVNGAQSGFSLNAPPTTPIIAPATSATFDVAFAPTKIGTFDGTIHIASDAGTVDVPLKGQGIDANSPTIRVISPAGGEDLTPGAPFKIQFSATDNDQLSNYAIQFSIDGGTSFTSLINPALTIGNPSIVIWDIPSDLQTTQGIIKVSATDKSGNPVSGLSGLFSIGGTGNGNGFGSNSSTDIKTKNTNMTDVYVMNRSQNSFTFVPLALEALTPAGAPAIDFPKDYNTLSKTDPGTGGSKTKVKIDVDPDLLHDIKSSNSGGGILISGADGGGLDGSAMRYCVQYRESDFNLITPGKGTITSTDANGNSVNASIVFPEGADFVDGESFLHPPVPPPANDAIGSATSGAGSGKTKIEISSLTGGSGESPITAYFNPKEITVDKSVSWQQHKTPGSDEPELEFTSNGGKTLDLELMFDMFEEKKSVKPELQRFLGMLGINDQTQNEKYGRVKVRFYWDREGKQDYILQSLATNYTMFLPDGKPCRAKVQLKILLPDSTPQSKRWDSHMTPGSHHLMQFFSTDIGPQTLQLLQGDGFSSEPLLHDPVFVDGERELRASLLQNTSAIVLRALDKSHRLQRVVVRGWDPKNKTPEDFNLANRFTFEIDGEMVGGIHSIDGLEHEHETVEYKDGDNAKTHHSKPGKFTITKDWGNTPEWFSWSKAGKTDRKSISIIFHNDAGEESGRMNFYDCFPTRYEEPSENAKNSGHASEKIEISYGDVDLLPAVQRLSGDIKTMTGSMSQSAQQMTMLLPAIMDGQKTDMILIGLLLPPLSAAPGSSNANDKTDVTGDLSGWKWNATIPSNSGQDFGDAGTGSSDATGGGRGYTPENFSLDLDGISAGIIQNINGGGVTGDVSNGKPAPGPITMDIMPTSSAIYDWIKSSLGNTHLRKSGEIHAADFKRDIRYTRHFKDALITEVVFPGCDGSSKDAGYINLTWTPEKIWNTTDSGKKGKAPDANQKKWYPANFRLNIDGIDCSHVGKIDAITMKQSTTKDDVGEARHYQKEPSKLDFPNLMITVPEEYAHDWWAWHEDFAIKGNNDDSKHKNGSIAYLDPTGKELLTLDFECMGIFKGTPESSENNSDKIRRVKYVVHIKNIKVR